MAKHCCKVQGVNLVSSSSVDWRVWLVREAQPAQASLKIRATATQRKKRKVVAECLPSPPTVIPLSPPPHPTCSKDSSGCFCPFQFDRMLPLGYINTTYIYHDPLSPAVRRVSLFHFLPHTQANVFLAFRTLPVILDIDKLFIQVEQRKGLAPPATSPNPQPPNKTKHHATPKVH